jgi:hypothetical protein
MTNEFQFIQVMKLLSEMQKHEIFQNEVKFTCKIYLIFYRSGVL